MWWYKLDRLDPSKPQQGHTHEKYPQDFMSEIWVVAKLAKLHMLISNGQKTTDHNFFNDELVQPAAQKAPPFVR